MTRPLSRCRPRLVGGVAGRSPALVRTHMRLFQPEGQPLVLRREHELLRRPRAVEAQARRTGRRRRASRRGRLARATAARRPSMPRSISSVGGDLLGAERPCRRPCPVPIGTVESKMTMPTSGRTAMFCEWRAPGFETQKNSRYDAAAYQTGDAQGTSVGVGRAERHVAVAVDDRPRHRLALGDFHHTKILARGFSRPVRRVAPARERLLLTGIGRGRGQGSKPTGALDMRLVKTAIERRATLRTRRRLDRIDDRLEASGAENVEAVLRAWELRVDDGVRRCGRVAAPRTVVRLRR